MYIFGPKSKICYLWWDTPPTCTPSVVYMSAQMFRDPKSSNRIQISKINKNLTNQDITILFEDFKFVETAPPTHTHTYTPPTPRGGPPNLLEHDKTLTNQDISILFENLKFVNHPTQTQTHPPPKGDSQINWNVIKLEQIKIFQFCLKIWNLWRLPNLWVASCQITKIK